MKRFDSLVHVTRDGRWINGRDDASLARLVAELDRGGVDRACLVGLAGVVDNEYVLECAAASGDRLVPIAGFDAARVRRAATGRELERLAAQGFRGIKLHPRLNGFDPLGAASLETIKAASECRLVVFLDTLFRQTRLATPSAADVIDTIVHDCPDTSIVLLHGGGGALLDVAEIVRLHPTLTLDLSFALVRYAGSSLDLDMRWVMGKFDQRVVIGSDMPEHTPAEAFARAERLAEGLAPEKWANIAHENLTRLFAVNP